MSSAYNLDREFQNYIGQSVIRQRSDEKRPLLWSHLLVWVYNSHMENLQLPFSDWEVDMQAVIPSFCYYANELILWRWCHQVLLLIWTIILLSEKNMSKFVFRALILFLFSKLRKLHSVIGQFVAIGKLMMGGKNNHDVF